MVDHPCLPRDSGRVAVEGQSQIYLPEATLTLLSSVPQKPVPFDFASALRFYSCEGIDAHSTG